MVLAVIVSIVKACVAREVSEQWRHAVGQARKEVWNIDAFEVHYNHATFTRQGYADQLTSSTHESNLDSLVNIHTSVVLITS